MVLHTTAARTGIATSIEKNGVVYLVSTILRTDLGSGFFQIMVLRYPERSAVYRIERTNQLGAVEEHIDTVKMVLAKNQNLWEGTKLYQDDVIEMMSNGVFKGVATRGLMKMKWNDSCITKMLEAAGLKVSKGFWSGLFG